MNELLHFGAPADEKPLDRVVTDGGFSCIFRTVACVGDSLSSGEYEIASPNGGDHHYYDMFEYSWGQYLARAAGFTAYNFSRGGMTTSEYCESYAQERGWWDPSLRAQAYIIALGINDLIGMHQELGEMSDINPDDPTKNAKTVTGYYARIIQQYKAIAPDAKFFLVSMPRNQLFEPNAQPEGPGARLSARLHEFAEYFTNTYVIDLHTYAPLHDEEFVRRYYLYGHMTPAGYRIMADHIGSYIDYIVRHNPEDFKEVGFINSDIPRVW